MLKPSSLQTTQDQMQPDKNTPQQNTLEDLMKACPLVKTLTHEKVQFINKFIKGALKPKIERQFRYNCKKFFENSSPQLFQKLTNMTLKQFAAYLRKQKQSDDQKREKLRHMIDKWAEKQEQGQKKSSPWTRFFQRQRNIFRKKKFTYE